ncbi:MAG: hypothetical protein K2M91_16080 [Lachnospiraceae bacterium]|nr:hypothetical protein [Lachnospiraceae bacterium]
MSMMLGMISSNTKKLEVRDKKGKSVGTVTISMGQTQKEKKKSLPYSYKSISTRLLSTKSSGNAHQVLISAKQKAASLRLMYKGGVYDDDEVFAALMHAQAITRVAKKRMNHLEEEERIDKKGGFCEAELEEKTEKVTIQQEHEDDKNKINLQKMQKLMEQYERMMQETMKELEQLDDLDELSDEMGISTRLSMDPEDLELLKKKHRADEMRGIMEADMKYLKAKFDKLDREKQSNNSYNSSPYGDNGNRGVSLQLSGVNIPVQSASNGISIVQGGAIDAAV